MKKLSFIFAFVLAAGTVMAQPNKAVVNNDGSFNTSYINQTGGVNGNNSATITQIGDLNGAAVADHFASSLFEVLDGAKGITQFGTGNTGMISQTNLFAGTVEAGPEAGMQQFGNNNSATITQSHNGAWMQEYAWVKQVGFDNTSLQNQAGLYGFSHVLQLGSSNSAGTQQLGGYDQKANVLQRGNTNSAFQFQGSISSSYTEKNLAEVSQFGNNNISSQIQLGSSNIAKTVQETDVNHANLIQNGNFNTANVLQKEGDFNVVNLTQDGGAYAEIEQEGDYNTLMGLGTDIMATSLNGSKLYLDQDGTGNTLHLQQTNGAWAHVDQDGMTNTSVIIQN